ncbi:MAG TPA: hypothetical protein VK848_08445, partial [Acidimicrobiia bacterium]|nr:hypothetical protein [Acidimicrobiia bacterium]
MAERRRRVGGHALHVASPAAAQFERRPEAFEKAAPRSPTIRPQPARVWGREQREGGAPLGLR